MIIIGRVDVFTAKAAYSRQTFPVTICMYVCLWICVSVQCIVEKRQIAARLLLGEFLELQARRRARRAGLARDVASRSSNAALLPHDCGQTC